MKVADLLKKEREQIQYFYDAHQLWLKTNGEQGLRCLSPEKMEKVYHRSDKEIIQQAIDKGLYIEDADKYLN